MRGPACRPRSLHRKLAVLVRGQALRKGQWHRFLHRLRPVSAGQRHCIESGAFRGGLELG